MAKDKELSTNNEVKRSEEFQTRVDLKEKVLDTVKEVLVSATESAFSTSGYEKKDGHAGEYGDGSTYGTGAASEKFNIKIAGKTKTFLQKEIIFGTKTIISIINIIVGEDAVTIEYKSPESGFYRGVDANGKTYMINEKLNLSIKNLESFKKEIQKLFTAFAKKELGFLISTKIGVQDKTEKSTSSIVETTKQELNMKKLTIKDLYSETTEPNSEKIKSKNTLDLDKTNPPITGADDKKMFFDEEEDDASEIKNEITTAGPAISGSQGGFKDGANSGAGGYNTKEAWKKTSYAQGQKKRPTVTKDWKVVPENAKEEVEKSSKKSEDSGSVKEKASSAQEISSPKIDNKSNGVSQPGSMKNFDPKSGNGTYKNTNQSGAPASDKDDFWQEVKLIPGSGYVPTGMDQNYVSGMHNASKGDMKKKGYAEGEENKGKVLNENTTPIEKIAPVTKQPDLTRRKFFTLTENQEKGINKRYLITEKTTDEYEKERWKKLSSFKLYESIKEAEEMNEFFESLANDKPSTDIPIVYKKNISENVSHDDIFNEPVKAGLLNESTGGGSDDNETVNVQKPSSKFGTEYKFLKKDFLNENKRYILDINTATYVINPNFK